VVHRPPIYHNAARGLWYLAVLGTTMAAVGKRTSVYLSDDLAAAVRASGVPLGELIRRGLEADIGRAIAQTAAAAQEPVPAAAVAVTTPPKARRRCPHPGTRVIGGWCGECGVVVEAGGFLPG
jgi:hypothetical protein